MHRMRNEPRIKGGPETSGSLIHWAPEYDFHTSLLGFGVNSSNSKMVAEMAKIQPGERVLDVGCGSGNLTLTAQAYAGPQGEVHGIDGSPEMIEVAKEKARRKGLPVIFEVGLIEQLSFPNDTFDVIISRLVIHHLPDDLKRKGFAEFLRVLKPGGRLFIADFNPPTNPLMAHIATAIVGSHMMQTTVWNLPPMLTAAGFAEVASGPTRSAFLAFVSGKKPAA